MVRFCCSLCVIILVASGSGATVTNSTGRLTTIICSDSCPVGSQCDLVSGYCRCTAAYPAVVDGGTRCLPYKHLDEECSYSAECSHIENADCIRNPYKR